MKAVVLGGGIAGLTAGIRLLESGAETTIVEAAPRAGGLAYLKSLRGPLPDIRFCPTGSITREKAPDYLALSNVACVGGSWVATTAQIDAGDWETIQANAYAASQMAG